MIVVTAPTGNIGRRVLSGLLARGVPLRVIARDPSKLPDDVRGKVEIVEGSHGDAGVVERAFEGARAVFWLPPGNPAAAKVEDAYVGLSRPAVAAAKASGVRQVVTISAVGRGWTHRAGHIGASIAMDDLFARSGAAVRELACVSLMENLLRQTAAIGAQGTFTWPTPIDVPARHVASGDVAANAVRWLADASWAGSGTEPMLGPEDLTFRQMMAIASAALGKEIRYNQMTLEDLRATMIARGSSIDMADAMVEMMAAKEQGIDDLVHRTPALTEATPTTFRQWCETVLAPAVER